VVNIILGAGYTMGAGAYITAEGKTGFYFRAGIGVGLDVSAGGELGSSKNRAAFGGDSEGVCGGVGPANGCVSSNSSGKTVSGGAAAGPTEVIVSGHTEKTYTFTTKPKNPPRVSPEATDCSRPHPYNHVCNR